jgi:hypothetical protein
MLSVASIPIVMTSVMRYGVMVSVVMLNFAMLSHYAECHLC